MSCRRRDGGASQIAPISRWNVSDFSYLFADMPNFNADISSWDTSSAVTMRGMFQNCRMFNRNISNWDVSRVVDMTSMFEDARAFNRRLSRYVRQHAARSTRATGPTEQPVMLLDASSAASMDSATSTSVRAPTCSRVHRPSKAAFSSRTRDP